MRNLMVKLWADDAGVVTIEYLVLGTFLGLALIVGVAAIAKAVNGELIELGNAVLTFNQGYNVCNYSICCASKDGSGATDSAGNVQPASSAFTGTSVDVAACP